MKKYLKHKIICKPHYFSIHKFNELMLIIEIYRSKKIFVNAKILYKFRKYSKKN